jgi:uncharacterized membrane protein
MESLPYIDFSAMFSWVVNIFHPGGGNLFGITLFWWGLISVVLSTLLIMLIVLVYIKLMELERANKLEYAASPEAAADATFKNERWEKIKGYLESDNPADWKVAILDADTLLDEMVSRMGYRGDNLGEQLKQIESSDFITLDDAWEAHKLRNKIAHQGDYPLTRREFVKAMGQFQRVFEEFHFI